MKLVQLLTEDRIITDFESTDLEHAIRELVPRLNDEIEEDAREEIIRVLITQESQHPTMINSSIWLPHLRAPGVKLACILLAVSRDGVPIQVEQGKYKQAKLIFLVLTPEMENTQMLQSMAAIARLCMNREALEALLHIGSSQRGLRIIADTGVNVKRTVLVRDIMDPNPVSLRENMNLLRAKKIIAGSGLDACPVLNRSDDLLGELSLHDLVRIGLPDYLGLLKDISFVDSLELFENFFRQERERKVGEVYTPDVLTIGPDAIIVEAANALVESNRRHMYVVNETKLTGIITISAIVRKIFLL